MSGPYLHHFVRWKHLHRYNWWRCPVDLSIHVGTGRISSPVLKCRSGPGVIPRSFRIDSKPQPSQPTIYMSVLIEQTPLNPSLSMLNVHITALISAVRSGEAVGAIFPPRPSSKPTRRMRVMSTASFAEYEPTRAFQTTRAFHPVVVCIRPRVFYHGGWFVACACSVYRITRRSRFEHIYSGAGRVDPGEVIQCKISVKCQFAKYYRDFLRKGEYGALAMIYMNRLSRLGSPDVL